jgi:hypothetical protein
MEKFYFNNECLIGVFTKKDFDISFKNTLEQFKEVIEKPNVAKGIVTEKLPSLLKLTDSYTLLDAIDNIQDKALKRLAFYYFRRYPIDEDVDIDDESLFEKNYSIKLGDDTVETFYLPYISIAKGYLFTIQIHDDLKSHQLELIENNDFSNKLKIDNLYGEVENTIVINLIIDEVGKVKLSTLEKVKSIIDEVKSTKSFDRDFLKLSLIEQESILTLFETVKKENYLFPIKPDKHKIKEVTLDKTTINIYELRVFNPKALRVYFSFHKKVLLIGLLGTKSSGNQDNDIATAEQRLVNLYNTI